MSQDRALTAMDSLEAIIQHRLANRGMRDAEAAAAEIIAAFIDECGGLLFYVSRKIHDKRQVRNAEILAEFDGSNQSALAKKHGLGVPAIYRILSKSRPA